MIEEAEPVLVRLVLAGLERAKAGGDPGDRRRGNLLSV